MFLLIINILEFVVFAQTDRTCEVREDGESVSVECSDGARFHFEDAIEVVNKKTGSFNTECSYSVVVKNDGGAPKTESKIEKKKRQITEDLIRIANKKEPVCYQESEEGEKRKLAKLIPLVEPVVQNPQTPYGSPRNPIYCELGSRPNFEAPKKKQEIDFKKDPKKYEQKTKIDPKKKERTENEKRVAKLKEKERYGIKPVTQQNPKRATTVPEAIIEATKPKGVDPEQKLEICFAIDSSGSMGDDVEVVKNNIDKIASKWGKDYPGGVNIKIVEFSQDTTDELQLRIKAKNGNITKLKKYTEEFKVVGSIEPKAAAVYECAQDFQEKPKTKYHVVVISDEVGDQVKGSPTPELAAQYVKEKKAELTFIDPDNLPIDPFQFEAPIGTEFKTSKGTVFKRVQTEDGKLGWQDLDSKLLWLDEIQIKVNYDQAQKYCKKTGARAPTIEEFGAAEDYGFRELLQDMKRHIFWSSTVHRDYSRQAFGFNGLQGFIVSDIRSSDGNSVRCVR